MAESVEYCLGFISNDTEKLQLVLKDDADNVIDLTGVTARMQLRAPRTGVVALEKIAVVVGGLSSSITFTFDPADTASLNPDNKHYVSYLYDIELTWPSAEVETPVYGSIVVKGDVTRG